MRIDRYNIIHTRIKKMRFIIILCFLVLLSRLYYLQVYNNDDLKLASLKQRSKKIELNSKRGNIYDRNLIPLTNNEYQRTMIIEKQKLEEDKELLEKIKEYTILSPLDLKDILNSNNKIIEIPIEDDFDVIDKKNIFIENKEKRYSDSNILSHVLGYINKSQNKGETGIEKVYDEFLNKSNNKILFVEYDKKRTMILGSEYYVDNQVSPLDPSAVQLTIDYELQREIEGILDKKRINGGVLVEDVSTGELLVCASRPNFDQDNIEDYLNSRDMNLYNKTVQVSYPPGSIFKIVVLLAALEEDPSYIDREFYCRGYEEVGNTKIKCSNISGHGSIDLKNGFSKSCNSVFIQIGKEIGAKKIIDMAKRLGFGEKINIGLLEEDAGSLPQGEELIGPSIGNISIGQGKIESTILQITNMTSIIANNGNKKSISIVKGITNSEGKMIKPYSKMEDEKVLSDDIVYKARELLEEVVWSGTAKSLDLEDIGGAAGKTGSAEGILNRENVVHGWFTGYYPRENPKYAITVLVEKGKSGSSSAVPIFGDICRIINKKINKTCTN